MEEELLKKITKMEKEFELERDNIRANYILNFIILFAYIFTSDIGSIDVAGYTITSNMSFTGISLIAIIFYWKSLKNYSLYIIRKYTLGVKS